MIFTWIDWNAVEVECVEVKSETTKTTSPSFIIPLVLIRSMVFEMLASISSDKSTRTGITPHCKFKAIRALLLFVNANMGEYGRLRDRSDAICPCFVYTKIASTPRLLAAEQAHHSKFEKSDKKYFGYYMPSQFYVCAETSMVCIFQVEYYHISVASTLTKTQHLMQ